MATSIESIESILKYLPRLLPEIKVSPLPEDIFLSTVKALVVPAASLSLSQWGILGALILSTNTSPALRKATVKLYGYISLIIGIEIALINSYVLVCSWISPSTTLQPVTVVTLNVLNSLVPVFTDTLVLIHLVKEKVAQSDSTVNLVSTMGAPILLKCMRLSSAVMFILASTEFIITSLTVEKGGTTPDIAIVETARTWNVYMSSSLHIVDNLYSFGVHWMHAVRMRKLTALASPLVPTNFAGLALSFGSQYVLPIVLNAAQLVASSSYIPSENANATMLIDSAKVVINIASASLTTLRKNLADPPRPSAFLRKAEEDLGSGVLKAPLAREGISGASGETVHTATVDPKDSVPRAFTPQ